MDIQQIVAHREAIIAVTAAMSVFLTVFVVSWPYLGSDQLGLRMRHIATERERIRVRERGRLKAEKAEISLIAEPRKLFSRIVDQFNLAHHTEDREMVRRLRMAGYRGQPPVVAFVAVRVVAPFVMFAIAAMYLFVIVPLDVPFFFKLAIAITVALIGYYGPAIYVKNRIIKRQQGIRRAWPDALDLLLICVESGMGIESAFRKVADEIGSQSVELAEELSLTVAELSYLQDRRKAFENLGERTGLEGVRSVVTSLIQAEKYGTPLGQSLRVLAQESRDVRMAEAEKKAAALPPKLTVPMILFFLPVLFAVIITPAAIQIAEMN